MEAAQQSSWHSNEVLHPERSVNDTRSYMVTQLNNGLRLLMITDPSAEKSACAISVRIGSLADPDSSLGLAHFLQHMLFMGSGKYPIHNEYSEFMTLNAGYDNAFTDDTETNYYFDIATDKFIEGVDRMSEFFKSAKLHSDCVQKERQAVHEQYVLWCNDDNCRKWGILHALGNGQFSRFTIGNQKTLNHANIHSDLKSFYEKYYSSNMINAVLLSNLPFDQLQQKTKAILETIPNKNAQPPKFEVPFRPEQLGKLIRIQSIKEEQTVEFIWVLDDLRPHFKHHIDEYIVHILGHEGDNSVFDLLKQNGFASSCTSYQHHLVHATVIGLEFNLTEEGYEHYQDVYNIVVKYVAQLQPSREIYQEIVDRNRLLFEFQDKVENTTYVHTLAQRMHYYPPENVLNYKKVTEPFDEKLFAKYLGQLTPLRSLVALSSNAPVENAKVEEYLGANYRVDPLPKLTKEPFPKLVIPPNKFLPVDTKVLPVDPSTSPTHPKKLQSNVVFLPDLQFRSCKGGISIHVYSNDDKIHQELYASWLQAMLKTQTYSAETLKTDLDYSYGTLLNISLYGFSDVILKLLDELPKLITAATSKQEQQKAIGLFCIEHETLVQDYQNALLEGTDDVASDYLDRVLKGKKNTTIEQDIETLEKLTPEDFLSFARAFWKKARLEWVFVGNFEESNIVELVERFETNLQTQKLLEKDEMGCLKIEQPLVVELRVPADEIKTSGAMVYYQYGRSNAHTRVVFQLLRLYMKEPFFNELRTQKQLAYLVRTQAQVERGVVGLTFTIVSSNTDANSVGKQMREFISSYLLKFSEQTEEQLDALKQSVLVSLTEPHDSLSDLFEFVNKEVGRRTFLFDGKQKAVVEAELKQLTKEEIMTVIKELLGRSLSVYVVAKCHEEAYCQTIDSKISQFAEVKASHNFYEDYARAPLETLELTAIPATVVPGLGGTGIRATAEQAHNKHRRMHREARLAERRQ